MRAFPLFGLLVLTAVILAGCAGTPAFTRLADTRWQLADLGNSTLDTDTTGRRPYLLMHSANHRVEGHTGCNRINGTYSGGGERLRFDSLASTRRYCADLMDRESALMHALERTASARVDDATLTLLDGQDNELARFTRQR